MARTPVDSAAKNPAVLTDACNPELVVGADFDGIFEMPIIKKPKHIVVPSALVPFSKMSRVNSEACAVCEFENDTEFRDLLINTDNYVEMLRQYQGFITPDCSVYRDMPLAVQITNIYRNRAIGAYMQNKGIYVIPNVRWGDERTFTTKMLPERVAFMGIEKHSIVSVGTYGQLRDSVNRFYLEAGTDAMVNELEPEVVLVYGSMPKEIKAKYPYVKFVEYEDWTSSIRWEAYHAKSRKCGDAEGKIRRLLIKSA